MVLDAIKNASNADKNPDSFMPELLETKVYKLGRAMYERMGKVRFEQFVVSLQELEQVILNKRNRDVIV